MKSYDLLIHIPLREEKIPADGFRSENVEFQRTIDSRVRTLIHTSPFAENIIEVVYLDVAAVGREHYAEYVVKEVLPRRNPYLPQGSLFTSSG